MAAQDENVLLECDNAIADSAATRAELLGIIQKLESDRFRFALQVVKLNAQLRTVLAVVGYPPSADIDVAEWIVARFGELATAKDKAP